MQGSISNSPLSFRRCQIHIFVYWPEPCPVIRKCFAATSINIYTISNNVSETKGEIRSTSKWISAHSESPKVQRSWETLCKLREFGSRYLRSKENELNWRWCCYKVSGQIWVMNLRESQWDLPMNCVLRMREKEEPVLGIINPMEGGDMEYHW